MTHDARHSGNLRKMRTRLEDVVHYTLMLAQDTDEAAAAAWDDRMAAMRDGCRAAIDALHADEMLAPGWTRPKATDALWAMLLVPQWEALTIECGWSTKQYVSWMKKLAEQTFVRQRD